MMKFEFKSSFFCCFVGPFLGLLLFAHSACAQVTPAHTGAWFDPDFRGAGFFVEVLPDNRALVYWFTYDDAGGQHWYLGVGDTGSGRIVINDLLEYRGGVFGDAFDPDNIEPVVVGSATLNFSNCNTADIEFQVDGVVSTQQLSRLTSIRDLECGGGGGIVTGITREPANQTGSWFNSARSGEGFIVEVLADQSVLVDWFTYDPDGKQAWLTGVGHAADDYIYVEEMLITKNGRFGPDHDPDAVELIHWGSLQLRLDCDGGSVVYDGVDAAWGQGRHDLSRLTSIQDLNCVHEAFQSMDANKLAGAWVSDGFGMAAIIDTNTFSLFEVTSSTCIEVSTGPTVALQQLGDELTMISSGNRLRFRGLDAVSPVDFNRVAGLPPHCEGGGTAFSNDPLTVFNAFYDTFDELYSAFEVRNVNWETRGNLARPSIGPGMTQNALFAVLTSMFTPLKDGHVSLVSPTQAFYSGYDPAVAALWQRAQSASVDQIIKSRLGGVRLETANGALLYGMTINGLAYLEINRFNDLLANATQEETLAWLRPQLDTLFTFFQDQGASGLIIDLRRNNGGNSNYGLEVAGRLSRGATRVIMSERRPVSNGLNTAIALSLTPVDGVGFDGPVVLLTSKLTASAAEIFTFAIKSLPHATLIGQPGIGVLSRTVRTLPNQWLLSITPGQVEAPNGEVYEAAGIPVDIATEIFSTDDLSGLVDSALDTAMDLLGSDG